MQKFDLHSHSDFSDGALSPQALIDYAVERNLSYLALTDHDTIDGLELASSYIEQNQLPISLINGVEISALSEFGEVHIVGLQIDPHNQQLIKALAAQRVKREERAELIDTKLNKLGVSGVLPKAKAIARQVITRTHLAKAIVELGYAKDMQQTFKRYLGKNGKVKVPKDWLTLEETVDLIKQAGGIAVLAHPTRYPISNRKLSYLIESFSSTGGEAIEMAYPSLNADKIAWLKLQLEQHNLMASSGSDFHYPNLKWTDLGRFPVLPDSLRHVKEQLKISFTQ